MDFTQGPSLQTILTGDWAQYYAGDATHNANSQIIPASGFDGETCGGLHFNGWIGTLSQATAVYWVLAPNNDTTLQSTTGDVVCSVGIALVAVAANTATSFQFDLTISPTKTGAGNRIFTVKTVISGVTKNITGTWTNTTDPIRSCWLKAVAQSDGSEVRVATMAATAITGVPSQMNWQALGQ